MKNTRALGMLVVSVLLGLAVVIMTASRAEQQDIAVTQVVVANADLESGSKLNPEMLALISWPRDSVPVGSFAETGALRDRVLKSAIQRNEAILSSKLASVGSAGGLSAIISDGKRAMTVRVNDVVGVAGFALPGNYVDILVNTRQEAGKGGEARLFTRTVLEHVLVLAVAQEAGRDETKPKLVNAVTLELSPADAEKIDLARNVGNLSLLLRNQVDKASVATSGITTSQLFAAAAAGNAVSTTTARVMARSRGAPSFVAGQPDCVEVIQGGARSLNCF